MTVAELTRTTARIEHLLDGLIAQVTELRGEMRSTRAVLDLREQHQSERTEGRNRQMAEVTARLDAQQAAISDLQQLRWKVVGGFGVLTILGSGTAATVVRLIG